MKYVYPALSSSSRCTLSSLYPCLPLLCRFSRCCRLSFSLSLILCIPETHYLTRPNGMNGQKREKRAEERDATATQRTERRNERKRRRRRDAARLDETVNTAASTAESGLYHMQRPRRDGEGGLDQRGPTLPNKANT